MANYDELLLTVSNYNASKAQTDEPEIVTEKVNSDTVLNFGLIAAGIAAISALVAKIISDNKVKKIIKNDETLSALVDKIENTKSKLADLRSEYLAVENEYSEKISEYNEYAKIFGSKTVKFESITKVPEPTVEDPGHMKTVNTTTTRPNENFDPEKAKRYKALAKELNVLADKAGNIRSEISREYAALQGYIKQIKKEVRKYKYASEETVAQVNSKCDDFINDIDDFEEKLKKFPVVESVEEPEFENGEEIIDGNVFTEGNVGMGLQMCFNVAFIAVIASIIGIFVKILRKIKQIWDKKKSTTVQDKLSSEVSTMIKTSSELKKLGKECNKLSIQIKKASDKDEFDKIKNEALAIAKDIDKKYNELYHIFKNTRDKLEDMISKDIDDDTYRTIQTYMDNLDNGLDELTLKWGESSEYVKALQKAEFKGDVVKESVNSDVDIMLSIFESYVSEEITEDEYDILMSGF